MATDAEKLQMALDAFKHFGAISGQRLFPHSLIAIAVKNDWRNLEVLDGVKLGYAKGFFADGANYEIKLTGDGFAAVSAANETNHDTRKYT